MVAFIERGAPHLFTQIASDGTQFRCSDSFARKYLRTLGWSERSATRAAQKLPINYEQILSDSLLRQVYINCDHGIPAPLRVGANQTQTHFQMGEKRTWNKKGEKQIATMGMDEKRAFTLIPYFSWPDHRRYSEVKEKRLRFEPSHTHTYWSTQATMKTLVNDIIAPYFNTKKAELKLPPSQCSLWMIDYWSVHKSEEFGSG
jgi:hypothetical protein